MKKDNTPSRNHIALVGICNYTILGITSVLSGLFYNRITRYRDPGEITDINKNTFIIVVIEENNINFSYIYHLKKRVSLYGGVNLIVICEPILSNILYSVFNIACTYVPNNVTLKNLQKIITQAVLQSDRVELRSKKPRLTGLESEILWMLSEGLSLTQISRIQKRDIRTISSHKYNLMRKMGMPNTVKSISILSLYLKSMYERGHDPSLPGF